LAQDLRKTPAICEKKTAKGNSSARKGSAEGGTKGMDTNRKEVGEGLQRGMRVRIQGKVRLRCPKRKVFNNTGEKTVWKLVIAIGRPNLK